MFNATKGCETIPLYRNGQPVTHTTAKSGELYTYHVSSMITEKFNNATMTLQGRDGEHRLLNSTEFKVYTVGQ